MPENIIMASYNWIDEETEEGGGEDDFFRMDDEPIKSEVYMEDAAEDVADTIDE